jgi:hypothetical protein
MKRLTIIILCALCALCGLTSAHAQQPRVLSLDKKLWTLDAGGLYNTTQSDGSIALAFTFAVWYPNYGWFGDGYLTQRLRPSGVFLQSQTLTIHVRVTTLTGAPYFRFDSEPGNDCAHGCCLAASFRPYFTSGPIYGKDLTRWWSNPDTITLVSPSDIILTVAFDPAKWSSVYGGFGSQHPTEFAASLSRVQFIGATMGGGCFFGHGVSTDGGTAMLELIDYEIQ